MTKMAPLEDTIRRRAASSTPQVAMAAPDTAAATVPAGDDDRIPRVFLAAVDIVVLALALLGARGIAPGLQRSLLPGGALDGFLPAIFPVPDTPAPGFPPLSELSWLFVVAVPVTLVVMELIGGYGRLIGQSPGRLIASAVLSQAIAVSFSASIVFALKLTASSRLLIFTYGLFSALGLLTYRGAIWAYQQRRLASGGYAKNVLLVGTPRAVELVLRHARRHVSEREYRFTGWLDVPAPPRHEPERRRDVGRDLGLERLGQVDDLGDLLIRRPVHEVIAVESSGGPDWLPDVIEHCDYFRIRLRIVPDALLAANLRHPQLIFHGDPLRLPEVVLSPPQFNADALFVKRVIDIAVSASLLVLLAPLFLLIAAAIKLTTPHVPVLYAWRVIGYSGRPFTGYKFTTMVADADEQRQLLLDRNEMQGPVFKMRDDPRVTPLGRVLRKYSLNELPQLWSVLKGDMSLVGPRPAGPHELARYELWHKRKLSVKPGITCLWQVSGRNRISNFDDWVRLDLQYIGGWSLWLDFRILARTAWAVLSGSGS